MPDRVTLDVIDRPGGGLRSLLRRVRAARATRPAGLRALIVLGTGDFVARVRPAPTLRRVALLGAWEGGTDVDRAWSDVLSRIGAGARESWHVEAEVARAAFSAPWQGWTPDVTGARALEPSEPALVIIAGNLYGRHVPAFMRDVPGAVSRAFAHDGTSPLAAVLTPGAAADS